MVDPCCFYLIAFSNGMPIRLGYFMPRDLGNMYIERLDLYFLQTIIEYQVFLIISKQIYRTHYYYSKIHSDLE